MPACLQCATENAEGARFCGSCGAALPDELPAEPDRWIGQVVDSRYRVVSRLGSGGMGVVYRVEHLRLGKIAAMKVLSPDTAGKREMVQRFRLEAQAVSRLNHPNIVHTFDFGQWDGALYLIMEYVKGDDLATVLRREGALDFRRAAALFVQVCSALTEAHDAGIIHRDLKPENLMVIKRRDGHEHAKVLDFGLAKLREREDAAAITSGAQVLGTPYYMAPEQVRGEALDPRADVYSLGATLYRVLTGTPPFQAPSPMGVLSKHLTDDVEPPRARAPERALPPEADRIVLRAMAKSVEERYASASDVQRDLEAALAAMAGAAAAAAMAPTARALDVAPPPEVRRPAEAPTIQLNDDDVAEVADGSDRLRRQDVDAFERGLRRRRLLTRLLPALGAAAIAAAAWGIVRGTAEAPVSTEREPNNTPGYANLLPAGAPVRGTIGKALEGGHPDVDYFRVPAGRGARVVTARLEGVPGVDLILELFDSQGRRLAAGDAHGRGWGEWLQPHAIGPTESYVAVREVWVDGQKPTENAAQPYTLTVRWSAPQPGWELEPNDWEAAATPVTAGQSVRGYLGDADDRDWFAVAAPSAGALIVRVRAPAGVDVMLVPGEEAARESGKRAVAKSRQAAGDGEELTLEAAAGRPTLVGVVWKMAGKDNGRAQAKARKGDRKTGERDPKDETPPGADEPYELMTELRAAAAGGH